ncbi:2TM domain-containing protein [Marivirga harenae]|uniref:2TM domain-containing protein n=1 Tax=Marivirga harenae TaxID=2010992 RepID=UPI0026E0BA3F|nr:2TM domain-containing protein [Marivirga harenae]WKV13888.1 2TM domain-containing protein [Marivirga harenae]|tara:strand:+ start:192894 stop:193172 length:279 start_codon:yes stop_codon:yes gene_type:complete
MENRDEELWKLAEARVGFKRHLSTYLSVNVLVWLLWYFTGSYGANYGDFFLPWPAWMTFGWGIGITLHFLGVYVNNSYYSVDREYEKLKNKK